jgi:hypothetical protein
MFNAFVNWIYPTTVTTPVALDAQQPQATVQEPPRIAELQSEPGILFRNGKAIFNRNYPVKNQQGNPLYVAEDLRTYRIAVCQHQKIVRYSCSCSPDCKFTMNRKLSESGEGEGEFRPIRKRNNFEDVHSPACNMMDHEVILFI